ncbi:alpha/beta hydrolase [Lacibacter sp. H407]|uniref:alpha/beta hydrolase n=1 Tax=Lacibacter sp. H407 TaxID=3133423 RepID=UPI0030C1E0A7
MQKILLILASTLVGFASYAQREVKLYKGRPPGNLDDTNREVHVKTERGRLDSVTIPSIAVFIPEKLDSSKTSVIICPGGGYRYLSIFDAGYQLARELNKVGIVAIVLKYRTQIEGYYQDFSKVPFNDFDRAIEIIKDSANNWKIDVTKMGVIGFSAGGHLAAFKTVHTTHFTPAFSVLVYPVISFMDELTSTRTVTRKMLIGDHPSESQKKIFSSELHVRPGINPCLLIHAQDDGGVIVQNSLAFYTALTNAKVKAQMLLYQEGGHGFAMHNKKQNDHWLPMAMNWLRFNKFLINN